MKKIAYLLMASMAIFSLSSCKSKEDKALELIKDHMFKTLYDFESYEPIETKVDSAYTDVFTDSLIISYAIEGIAAKQLYNEKMEEFQDALDDMRIWSGGYSSLSRSRFSEANQKATSSLEKAKLCLEKMAEAHQNIKSAADNIGHDFIGWKVTHKFRAKSKGGLPTIGDYIYYMDPKFNEIIDSFDCDDESYADICKYINAALINDSEEEESSEESTI